MKYYLFILIMLLLCSCAVQIETAQIKALSAHDILTQIIDYTTDKAVFSSRYNTLLVLNKKNNEAILYQNNLQINKVGSSGFSQSHFKRLADACLSYDQYFLLLDSFDKSIKKYDANGQLISTFSLPETIEPIKLDMSSSGTLFVYDAGRKEILVYESVSLKYLYSFGRFQIMNLQQMTFSGNRLVCYDAQNNQSTHFLSNGQLTDTFDAQVYFDYGQNMYFLENQLLFIKQNADFRPLVLSVGDEITVKDKFITQISKGFIKVYEIRY